MFITNSSLSLCLWRIVQGEIIDQILLQVRHCPLCEKIFESSHYLVRAPQQKFFTNPLSKNGSVGNLDFETHMTWKLFVQDMHVARRHPKPQEVTEEKILAMISKAEEVNIAQVHIPFFTFTKLELARVRSFDSTFSYWETYQEFYLFTCEWLKSIDIHMTLTKNIIFGYRWRQRQT